jgi:hypothetical protein
MMYVLLFNKIYRTILNLMYLQFSSKIVDGNIELIDLNKTILADSHSE